MRALIYSAMVAIILGTGWTMPGIAETSNGGITPDPETQKLLAEALQAGFGSENFFETLPKLGRLAKANGPEFVRQAIYYETVHRTLEPLWFMSFQLLIHPSDFAAGIAPLLYCDNDEIRASAREAFRFLLNLQYDEEGQHNLRDWPHLPAEPEISKPLARAAFETSPVQAFFFYTIKWHGEPPPRTDIIVRNEELVHSDMRPYRRYMRIIDNFLFQKKWLGGIPGGKVDSQTLTALRELSQSKYWWSRLFVAEIMVQNKEFRDSEIIERLANDPHDLVRGSIASLTNPDPLRFTGVDK